MTDDDLPTPDDLTSAYGAFGSHANAVQDAKKDFRMLAGKIADGIGMEI